jgi:hypothetical protein
MTATSEHHSATYSPADDTAHLRIYLDFLHGFNPRPASTSAP